MTRIGWVVLLLLSFDGLAGKALTAQQKPNIVYIMADEPGYYD